MGENIEYPVKRIGNKDADRFVRFHNRIHNDNRTAEQWIWEYETNHPDHYVFTIMQDGDRIIGSQGMIPIHLNINGDRLLTGKSENSILDPEYRGGSKFQKLYEFAMDECARKGMALIWGFTPAVKVWRDKLNFMVDADCMYEATYITNLSSAISNFRMKNWPLKKKLALSFAAIVCSANASIRHHSLRRKTVDGAVIEPELREKSDLEKLFARLRESDPNMIFIEPGERYLAWRLKNNPNNDYVTLFLYEGSELKGYCYYYLNREKKTGEITDITFLEKDAGLMLLARVIADARQHSIGYLTFFGNAKNRLIKTVFDLLKKSGFINKKHSNAFVLRNISFKDGKHISNVENWYMNGLWKEGYGG